MDDKWSTPQWKKRTVETNTKHLYHISQLADPEVILLGSSMLQCLEEVPEVNQLFKEHIEHPDRVVNYGCGGDRIGNILYRLEEGMLLKNFCQYHIPKLVIVMAGANDIEQAPVTSMVHGMKRVIQDILHDTPTQTQVVVLGMFPRLSSKKSEMELIDKVNTYNSQIKQYVLGLSHPEGRLHYSCCGHMILSSDGTIDRDNLFDLVHLSVKGNAILVNEIAHLIRTFAP